MLSKKDKQGLILIAIVVVILFGLLAAKFKSEAGPKPGADNCVGNPTRSTVVLLDHSQLISEQTQEEIVNRAMLHIFDNVKVNERVSIFIVSDLSKKEFKPIMSLCRPPSDGNRAIENVQLIKKRFRENFENPVRKALSVSVGNSKESPIAQAITDLTLSQYLRAPTNTLLVFSDMLENTSRLSFYNCSRPDRVIPDYREAVKGGKERPTFRNTKVVLNIIPRPGQAREVLVCRDKFWVWFLSDNEGPQSSVNLDYLPGL